MNHQNQNDQDLTIAQQLETLVITENKFYSTEELREFAEIIFKKIEDANSWFTQEDKKTEPTHGDVGDMGFNNATTEEQVAFRQRQTKLIYNLRRALYRISTGAYGICEKTKEKIPAERLRVQPMATETVLSKISN